MILGTADKPIVGRLLTDPSGEELTSDRGIFGTGDDTAAIAKDGNHHRTTSWYDAFETQEEGIDGNLPGPS